MKRLVALVVDDKFGDLHAEGVGDQVEPVEVGIDLTRHDGEEFGAIEPTRSARIVSGIALGIAAAEQQKFEAVERWHRESLAIKEEPGDIFENQSDEHGAASTWLHLGTLAKEQQDFELAAGAFVQTATIFYRLAATHEYEYCALLRALLRATKSTSSNVEIRRVAMVGGWRE